MSRKARGKKDRDTRRELLFCNTQPVVGGWLTSTVLLELHFTRDEDAPQPSHHKVSVEREGVGSDDPRLGEGREASLFPGDTVREPHELEDYLKAEEEDAFPKEASFTEDS